MPIVRRCSLQLWAGGCCASAAAVTASAVRRMLLMASAASRFMGIFSGLVGYGGGYVWKMRAGA